MTQDGMTVIENGNNPIILSPISDEPLDILDRQPFIDDIIKLLDTISATRSSCTFALDGKWGVGKSFVLDRLCRQLRRYQGGNKYIIFQYNCWKYDYYEEPLVAILTAMLDSIDAQKHLLPRPLRKKLYKVSKATRSLVMNLTKTVFTTVLRTALTNSFAELLSWLGSIADTLSQKLLKKPLSEILPSDSDQKPKADKADDAEKFDTLSPLNSAIARAQSELRKLARDRSLVIVVDELDRCLPDYAIKVLERLHHLFYGLENSAVILGIDKSQLAQSIKQSFGEKINTDNYLRKLINFELTLDAGNMMENFPAKYAAYFNLFDDTILKEAFPTKTDPLFRHDFSCDRFFSALLKGLSARKVDRIMERCTIIHSFLFGNTMKDHSLMYLEVLWIVLTEEYGYTSMPLRYEPHEKESFIMEPLNPPVSLPDDPLPKMREEFCAAFNAYLTNNWNSIHPRDIRNSPGQRPYFQFVAPVGIPELLVCYLQRMYSNPNHIYKLPVTDDRNHEELNASITKLYDLCKANFDDFKKFDEYRKIIK